MWFSKDPRGLARPDDDAAAESPLRQQILDVVKANPGIPIGELMTRLGVGWGTVYHHITKLSRSGMVRTHASGRRRLVFPAPWSLDPQTMPGYAILRGKSTRRVARAVMERPGSGINELCEEIGESPRVVYYHVKRLLEAGLIQSSSRTRHNDLRPTDRLPQLMAHLGVEETVIPVLSEAPMEPALTPKL